MSRRKHKQGQSKGTAHKQHCLSYTLHILLSIFKRKQWTFNYCDVYCGCGFNDVANCKGSPLTFNEIAIKSGIPDKLVNATFSDISADQVAKLRTDYPELSKYRIEVSNSRDLLFNLRNYISGHPKYAKGLIFIDPNNIDEFPLDALNAALATFESMDVLLCYPTLHLKRARCLGDEKHPNKKYRYNFEEMIQQIPKRYWKIRDGYGKSMFALLFGSNFRFNSDFPAIGMYDVQSPKGQELLRKLSYTATEREAMPTVVGQQISLF